MKIADAQTLLKLTPADHSAATVREALDFALWWVIAFVSSLLVFVAPVAFVIHLIVDC
jgi:hypothetical protein